MGCLVLGGREEGATKWELSWGIWKPKGCHEGRAAYSVHPEDMWGERRADRCSRARGQRLARILRRERKQVPKCAEDRRGQEMQKPASSDIRGRRLTPKESKV